MPMSENRMTISGRLVAAGVTEVTQTPPRPEAAEQTTVSVTVQPIVVKAQLIDIEAALSELLARHPELAHLPVPEFLAELASRIDAEKALDGEVLSALYNAAGATARALVERQPGGIVPRLSMAVDANFVIPKFWSRPLAKGPLTDRAIAKYQKAGRYGPVATKVKKAKKTRMVMRKINVVV